MTSLGPLRVTDSCWLLSTPGGLVRVQPPTLQGKSSAGKPFILPLSFADCKAELCGGSSTKPAVMLPGGVKKSAINLCGQSDACCIGNGFKVDWELDLVPHESNVLLQLRLSISGGHVDGGRAGACPSIEHIELGAFEVGAGEERPAEAPVESLSLLSTRASTALAAVATLAAVPFLPSAGAAATAVLAPCAAWWHSHRAAAQHRVKPGVASFLINGWQSFSFSGTIDAAASQPRTSLPFFSGAFHTGATPPAVSAGGGPRWGSSCGGVS